MIFSFTRMKKGLFALSVAVSVFIFSACEKEEPIGKWDDIIGLSEKSVNFEATADSVIITTEGDWWWVEHISVDDSVFIDFEDVNLESHSYKIARDYFVVERRDENTLFIKADANDTGSERVIIVGLEAGNYFDAVTVTQAAN